MNGCNDLLRSSQNLSFKLLRRHCNDFGGGEEKELGAIWTFTKAFVPFLASPGGCGLQTCSPPSVAAATAAWPGDIPTLAYVLLDQPFLSSEGECLTAL